MFSNNFFISWKRNDISTEAFLNMRYDGTDCALMCTASERDVSTVILIIAKYCICTDNSAVLFVLSLVFQIPGACHYGNFEKAFLKRYCK